MFSAATYKQWIAKYPDSSQRETWQETLDKIELGEQSGLFDTVKSGITLDYVGPAIWCCAGVDIPVVVTGYLGVGSDGRCYFSTAESASGVPGDELRVDSSSFAEDIPGVTEDVPSSFSSVVPVDASVVATTNDFIQEQIAETRLQCPGWVRVVRSCGYVQWVPAPCSSPTCGVCQKIWAERVRQRWLPVLASMHRPKLITLTIPSSFDLVERVDYEAKTFRRFLDTRLGSRNWAEFNSLATAFLKKHLDVYEPDVLVREERYTNGVKSLDTFGRALARFERKEGRSARVRDVIGPGFSSREVTWSDEHGWHLHRHLTVDSWFIPWSLLVVVWQSVGGGPVVDIRAIGVDYKSIREAVKYLTKFWMIPDDRCDEVCSALKGKKKIWPLGGAKPEPVDHICPECKCIECVCEQYRLAQTFKRWVGKDGRDRVRVLVYGVFDEEDYWVTLVCVGGRWREEYPYLDRNGVCVTLTPVTPSIRAGPDTSVVDAQQYGDWLEDVWLGAGGAM
jgi:hypothetical protein